MPGRTANQIKNQWHGRKRKDIQSNSKMSTTSAPSVLVMNQNVPYIHAFGPVNGLKNSLPSFGASHIPNSHVSLAEKVNVSPRMNRPMEMWNIPNNETVLVPSTLKIPVDLDKMYNSSMHTIVHHSDADRANAFGELCIPRGPIPHPTKEHELDYLPFKSSMSMMSTSSSPSVVRIDDGHDRVFHKSGDLLRKLPTLSEKPNPIMKLESILSKDEDSSMFDQLFHNEMVKKKCQDIYEDPKQNLVRTIVNVDSKKRPREDDLTDINFKKKPRLEADISNELFWNL